jgi:hypothetical protein
MEYLDIYFLRSRVFFPGIMENHNVGFFTYRNNTRCLTQPAGPTLLMLNSSA